MAIQNYLETLKKARATGTPGNFARANTRIPANMQNGVPVYEKPLGGTTTYAPEIFDTGHDRASLAKVQGMAMSPKPANENGGNVINFGLGSFGNTPLNTPSNPAADLAMAFNKSNVSTNTVNNATTPTATPNAVTAPTPIAQDTSNTTQQSTYLDDLNARIKTLQDAINQRYEGMKTQATTVSNLNKSNITGNLGRVFGNNFDTSEAAPITAENKALEQRLREIDTARSEALANNDMAALDKIQAEQTRIQSTQAAQRQQDFNNAIAQASLTGNYGGARTLDAQNQDLQKALQEAGLLGMYNGTPTLQAMSTMSGVQTQALQRALDEAGVTGMYNGNPTLNALNSTSGITGYYGGQPTLARDQLNLGTQNKQINDILDYMSSTQNNLNTNSTKMSLADINNQADLDQLLKKLSSQEGIAGMNNQTKLQQIAINQQKADAYTKKMSEISTKKDSTSLSQAKALDALIKMRNANAESLLYGKDEQFTPAVIQSLEETAGLSQKKNNPVVGTPSSPLGFLDSLVKSMGLG